MIKVNLQPKIVIEIKEGVQLPLWPVGVFGAVIVIAMISFYWNMNTKIISSRAEIRKLDFKLRDFQRIIKEYEEATNERKYLQGKRDFVYGISKNQKLWVDFFDELKSSMPTDVWITRFEGNRTGEFRMEGNTYSYSAIGFLMLQLYSIDYITSISLENASAGTAGEVAGKTVGEVVSKRFQLRGTMSLVPKKK
ncbi:MAG: PilN domain-containing protein [bacterium]